jgi:RimJ/RimL family protein N-acetyltransferase
VIWKEGPVASYGVGTDPACRSRGYGLTVVSAATRWILDQDQIAVYGAYANNIPSLRIARRLGFAFVQQKMAV